MRHGQGYTVFEHTSHGIAQELLLFVPLDAPVKISLLRLRNTHRPPAPPLGDDYQRAGARRPARQRPRLTSSPRSTRRRGAIFARNPYNNEFAGRASRSPT